jgi:hypothetical protein
METASAMRARGEAHCRRIRCSGSSKMWWRTPRTLR